MRCFLWLAPFLTLGPAAFGQHLISFGIKGGVPFTDAFSDHTFLGVDTVTHSFSATKNYAVGPMLELRLPLGFSVEADALYRPLNLTVENRVIPTGATRFSADVHSVEFPILAKYHFLHAPLINPYIEAGPTFRTVGSSASYLSDKGFVAGVGVDLKLLVLRISPEIRISRWGDDQRVTAFVPSPSNLNQAEFLIGLSF